MLKAPSYAGAYAGTADEVQRPHARHAASVQKKAFGQVVGLFFDLIYGESHPDDPRPESSEMTFVVSIQGGGRDELKRRLQSLVSERNEVIHPRLLGFDGSSEPHSSSVRALIRKGIDQGAKLDTRSGGRLVGMNHGFFVKPAVFSRVSEETPATREGNPEPMPPLAGQEICR